MGKFDHYKIPLKSLSLGDHSFEYKLDNEYFKIIDGPEVQRGNVSAKVMVRSSERRFDLTFSLEGTVKVPCDRCLDDVEVAITHSDKLVVKFGQEYGEEGDDIIVIPESEGELNLAWFLYEFVALSIPIKHIHAPGKCNKLMTVKLGKHLAKSSDGDGDEMEMETEEEEESMVEFDETNEQSTDPRWDELKKIIDNN